MTKYRNFNINESKQNMLYKINYKIMLRKYGR